MRSVAPAIILQVILAVRASATELATSLGHVEEKGANEVSVNAGGSMVRRQSEETSHSHSHEPADIAAMFNRLDADGDGFVTSAEIKVLMEKRQYHSQALSQLLSEATQTTGTSLEEFTAAVHKAAKLGALHHMKHEARVHQHGKEEHIKNNPSTWTISCGGHKAETCEKCPTTDSQGSTVFDHGHEWCNGDCIFNPGSNGGGTCHKKGTITVTGTIEGTTNGYSTTPVPDLLNDNITAVDQEVIDKAAKAAITEENLEAAEKQRQEEEAAEEKKWTTSKFWLVVIITFSVILGICAIVNVVGLVVIFCFPGLLGPAGKEEGEALADDAGEADGEDEATAEADANES